MPDPDHRVALLADTRYSEAADRDDAALGRDDHGVTRDGDAEQRDIDAEERVRSANGEAGFFSTLRLVLDHFTRIANTTVDPADWPDLAPDSLDHLRAFTARQQLLCLDEQAAISAGLHDLHDQLRRRRDDQRAAAGDRRAAAQDRHRAAVDRRAAAGDRDLASRDRSQAAIDRELTSLPEDSGRLVPTENNQPEDVSVADRVAHLIETSRRRVADSRALLAYLRSPRADPTAPDLQPGGPGR